MPPITPPTHIRQLAALAGNTQNELKQLASRQGLEAQTSTPEEFSRFVRSEVVKMAKIIKESGARPE